MLIAEGMWQQMAMNSGATMQPGPYPERSGEPDCTYYLRTGLCRFGISCRFNHPPDRNLVNIHFSKLSLCGILLCYHQIFCIFSSIPVLLYIGSIVKNHVQLEGNSLLVMYFSCTTEWCVYVTTMVFNCFSIWKHTKISAPVCWW